MVELAAEWNDALADFSVWLKAGGLAPGTIQLRCWWIAHLAHYSAPAGPWDISPQQILQWASAHDWQPNTRRSARAAVRRFYQWARLLGHRMDNPSEPMLSVRLPAPTPKPAPLLVLEAALGRAANDKERLMLLLASYAGLRRTEIASVHADDIEGEFLLVQGKGGRQRFVPIHSVVRPYLETVQRRGGWAFPGRFEGHCHPDFIGKRLSRLLGPGWTGHSLRHFFASQTYWRSKDLRSVQELLGHASIATTQIYVGVNRQALIQTVQTLPSEPVLTALRIPN